MAVTAQVTDAMSVQMTEQTGGILRLIADQCNRSLADVVREATEAGMPKVAGYKDAASAYAKGVRAAKAPARGGPRALADA